MIELIVGVGIAAVLSLLGGIYFSDKAGWHQTFLRISRISRANLEARNYRKLEKVYVGDKDAWTAAFEGRQAELMTLPEEEHKIIRHDYYQSTYGPWPRWTCKCGQSENYVADGILWFTERKAIRKGRQHIRIERRRARRIATHGQDFLF